MGTIDTDRQPARRDAEAPLASGGTCAISASPFTAEELALLEQIRALKHEWRELAGRVRGAAAESTGAGTEVSAAHDSAAVRARLRAIDTEAARLRQQAAAARRRRMIALGHIDGTDEPIVSVEELKQGRGRTRTD